MNDAITFVPLFPLVYPSQFFNWFVWFFGIEFCKFLQEFIILDINPLSDILANMLSHSMGFQRDIFKSQLCLNNSDHKYLLSFSESQFPHL